MHFADKSAAYGGLYVPACTVALGSPDKDMLTDHGFAATSVKVDLALSMSGTFSFSIPDTFDAEHGDFLTKGKKKALKVLAPGTPTWISMGYGDRSGQKLLIAGYIIGVTTSFSQGSSPTLEVTGVDSTYLLSLGNEAIQRTDITVPAMVSELAKASGLSESVTGVEPTRMTLTKNNENSLQYITRLAAEFSTPDHKFEFYARPSTSKGTLHFGPRKPVSDPFATLSWGIDLLSFTPEMHLADQVTKVVVHSWDEVKKEKVLADASPAGGGEGGGDILKRSFSEAAVLHLNRPSKSLEEAKAHAEAELARRQYSFVGGKGETFGLPELLPDTVIAIEGVGPMFSKTFYVSKTVHRFGTSGYRTEFTVERPSL